MRALVRLAVPISIAQLGLMMMSLVDTAAIGRVSVDDLAGAGIGRSIGFGTAVIGIGLAGGLDPLAAQAIGAGEPERAWQAFLTTVRATLLLWPLLMGAAFAITLSLPAIGLDPAVITRVRLYLAGQAPGFAAIMVTASARTFLQAHGRTTPALVGSVVANVVNVPMVNLLVRGDAALRAVGLPPRGLSGLGALGGGIAFSVASMILALFVGIASLGSRPRPADARERDAAPITRTVPRVPLRTVFRVGLPLGLQMFAEVAVFSLVALLSGALGPEVASAHHIAIGLASFMFMGALGMSGATAVRVGYAIGRGQSPRRAGALGMSVGAVGMLSGAVAFALFPEAILGLFTNDARVIAIGVGLLRIAALFAIFDGVQAVASGALRGAGDVRFPFLANVVAHWFIGFPAAMVLGFVLRGGAVGLWWGLTAGLVFVAVALAARFAVITRRPIARI
ncbi:MAG TPA: MATE family efflux transporter [Polyangiaceae bacterium]|nr:MATE family efflux transporter [Polyangiaceae bacterium]